MLSSTELEVLDTPDDRRVDRFVVEAQRAWEAGNSVKAIDGYCQALRLVNRYPPAKRELDKFAKSFFADAISARDAGDTEGAIVLLVRSRELNPDSGEVRDELKRLLASLTPGRDLTTECLAMPDAARASAIYREAIQTCMEFVAYGGISGEIFEFGVLGGWTARIFAETMVDLHYPAELYLFDSFTGLPRDKHALDQASYDVSRGVWDEEMDVSRLGEQIGEKVPKHIGRSLSRVISAERIKIKPGYFSETLQQPLKRKAALVHLDCDLYSSTKEVLDGLDEMQALQDGTVLMFDDWNCHRANPAFGQRRALTEFLEPRSDRYSISSFLRYGFNSAAFILHEKSP
ncbi:MAG: hypothetical protein FJX44_00080 [Alphaproteobacteria bacterium]|nr:hypothetical protein [Alphaproteobacteria bacterium]